MLTAADLIAVLAREWGLGAPRIEPLTGGMNSQVWLVEQDGSRWVAKAVRFESPRQFAQGLAVAAHVDAAGIPAGTPIRTRSGLTVIDLEGRQLALLSYVPGRALTGTTTDEQIVIGSTLGQVHRALVEFRLEDPDGFPLVDLDDAHLGIRDWIRLAVRSAIDSWDAIAPASWSQGLLHSDPAPEAFRFDPDTGRCGLIDWDRALVGPLLYDLASAVMYVGGPVRSEPLVAAYLGHGPISRSEVDRGLGAMLQVRWAVQADYFARRIATGDRTGIADDSENEQGLDDARRALGVREAR